MKFMCAATMLVSSVWTGTATSTTGAGAVCRNSTTGHPISGGGGHHHRRLEHSDDVVLMRTATCSAWISLLDHYTGEAGANGGSAVYVFSDGSTTSKIDAVIKRDGALINKASVMAHLHVGACVTSPQPAFDSDGVRASTVGDHWHASGSTEEVHFMFKTDASGNSDAMTCSAFAVDTKAMSLVLHENDATQNVGGMGVKKLCCDLAWTGNRDWMPTASSAAWSSTTSSAALAAAAAVTAAVLL